MSGTWWKSDECVGAQNGYDEHGACTQWLSCNCGCHTEAER